MRNQSNDIHQKKTKLNLTNKTNRGLTTWDRARKVNVLTPHSTFKNRLKTLILKEVIRRKLQLFGHICRMNDSREIKWLVTNKVRRPHRDWVDDILDRCRAILQELSHSAQDRLKWRQIVEEASDSNGHWTPRFMVMMMLQRKFGLYKWHYYYYYYNYYYLLYQPTST